MILRKDLSTSIGSLLGSQPAVASSPGLHLLLRQVDNNEDVPRRAEAEARRLNALMHL